MQTFYMLKKMQTKLTRYNKSTKQKTSKEQTRASKQMFLWISLLQNQK